MIPDLKKRRKELNLTLEQVGNIVGVGKSTVRKWETGYIENMKRDKILKLAQALKVSPSFIMGVEEEKNEKQNENTIFAKNLEFLMNKHDINDSQLAEMVDVNRTTITRWRKGVRSPKIEKLPEIAEIFGIEPLDLINEKKISNMLDKINKTSSQLTPPRQKVVLTTAETQLEEQQKEKSSDNVISPDFINDKKKDCVECDEVDVAGILAAGKGTLNFDKSKPIKTVNVPVDEIPDKYDLTFQISGDSMEPGFKDGELVYVDTLSPFKNKKVYAVEVNKEAYIKKVYRDGKTYTLVSLNNEKNENGDRLFPEITVTENDDFYIIGRIV